MSIGNARDAQTILVTGGCGFIGANFVHLLLRERPTWRVINLDALTYAGNLANVADVANHPHYQFVRVDVADAGALQSAVAELAVQPDAVVHFAAESHVDRSILGPEAFLKTNVNGTFHLLELARRWPGCRHVQVSTDEVYGSLTDTDPRFCETTPINPSSPYSASKAAADLLVQAYCRTFGLDAVITRCSNNYGPFQFPEKLIPLMIINCLGGKPLPVYGTGQNVRDWIHVEDHCRGVLAALERGRSGEVYHFGGDSERTNIAIVRQIAQAICGDDRLITAVADRPGHDWRYAMETAKARCELDWAPRWEFEDGLRATIDWYVERRDWWEKVLNKDYLAYYATWYGDR